MKFAFALPDAVRPYARRARQIARDTLPVPRDAAYSFRFDALTGGLTGVYMGMTSPFFVKIARGDLHASQTAIALLIAAPFVGNLFSPFWARTMEGREKKPFCVAAWVVARAFLLLMPLALTGNVFIGLVSCLQIVGAVAAPAYSSLMKDIYPDRQRGRLMGYVRASQQAALFFATLIAGRLLDHHVSFRYLFPVAGVVGVCAALCFKKVRPLPDYEAAPPMTGTYGAFLRDTVSILKTNKPYRYFAASVFVYGAANLMVQPLFGLYQVDTFHITNTQIANLANCAALCSIAGAFFWGRWMDKHTPAQAVLWSIVCIALVPLVYVAAQNPLWLLPGSALTGFGLSGIELAYMASILRYAEPGRAAQYQSLHSLLFGLRGVLAPLLSLPLMHLWGYKPVFVMAFGIMILGGCMQALAVRAARTAD